MTNKKVIINFLAVKRHFFPKKLDFLLEKLDFFSKYKPIA